MLGAVILTAGFIILLLYWQQHRQTSLRALACQDLRRIGQEFHVHGNTQVLIRALSIWLRCVCLSETSRPHIARLTGDAWLSHLDSRLHDQRFTKGSGHILATAPYQRASPADGEAVLRLCRDWAKKLPQTAKGARHDRL